MVESKFKKPGKLVKFRGRRCIIQPSTEPEIILLKPLGGTDDDIIPIFEPILSPQDKIEDDQFELPTPDDLDSFYKAKILYDAARLSFRQVSGPFRCMGKISFRPRSYQLVPLIMTLKMPITRLLIADDVGVGKTIEALLILREMLERGIIKSFAILCPPHLCDQWQSEIADKLDIEAVVIRSSTVATLERKIIGDDTLNAFNYYPYQVTSIDYVKNGATKMPAFLKDIPDLVIVDEAHTCTKNINFNRNNQNQQRYELLEAISKRDNQHLLLLTATPHSGKDGEFKSLLGLVNREFESYDFGTIEKDKKEKVASHFIQRKRENIKKWPDEQNLFPERKTEELAYNYLQAPEYFDLYKEVLKFVKGISFEGGNSYQARMKHFAALSLLRGVMSSPAAGYEMLQNRKAKHSGEEEVPIDTADDNPIIEKTSESSDTTQIDILDKALSESEWKILHKFGEKCDTLKSIEKDPKVKLCADQIKKWIVRGQSPIVFCRYIATAHYVAETLKKNLPPDTDVRPITSEMSDDERKEKIEEMALSNKRVLVATDCLSEGINLQDKFNAIMHYDLPWNPNRLEQREGRVDRYGQPGWYDQKGQHHNLIEVKVLFGEDNPIDLVVLRIILEKIQQIKNDSGITIAIADDNRSIMDRVLKEIILNPEYAQNRFSKQSTLQFGDSELDKLDAENTHKVEEARKKSIEIQSIFAHDKIKPEDVIKDLQEVDEAIGDVATLENFVTSAGTLLGAEFQKTANGYLFKKANMDDWLFYSFGKSDKINISFDSPTPKGYRYIGRNHQFVEQLCHRIIANSLDKSIKNINKASRAAVFTTDSVLVRSTLIQFRVRNVIREVNRLNETISEEMYLWGYEHGGDNISPLSVDRCKELLNLAQALDISPERQKDIFIKELKYFETLHDDFINVVKSRSDELVKAHTRFAKYIGAKRFEAVTPVLPPDILGVYILIPNVSL